MFSSAIDMQSAESSDRQFGNAAIYHRPLGCFFRMIHVGTHDTDVPPTTHRKQLGQREDAWQCFGYKYKCTLQPQRVSESAIHVDGGVYGSVREGRIHFARLPSVSDTDDEHSWSHPISVVPLLAFTFCPEQDPFVVVTSSPDE
ncbi:hypothetical protein AZE42_12307 [Rhizopogon vesiculosus]|uniref:Uncharacterized protein n=1 Tax=Rhizopogon vesiculosus TaxID=180088 RepID=A0A1J8QLM4_9AGAM|nr:hypothetical protein AZE42_12307 [Rhizopogon vesiculosus]